MKVIKRLVASVISLAALMSITTVSFADYNGGEAGNNGGQIIGNGGFYTEDQGIRLSVVNKDGTVYSRDNGKESVVDMEIRQPKGTSIYDNATAITNSTGSDKSSSNQEIKRGDPGEIVIDCDRPMIWNGSSFTGNGNAVKEHMLTKDENGDQKIKVYAKQYLGLDQETIDKINQGELKIEVEPIYNFPVYNKNGAYTGERVVGTVRDFIKDYVRDEPQGSYNMVMPALRGAVAAMILENDDMGLAALSPEELEKQIDWFIYNGNLDELGVGMHIFNLGGTPQTPEQPQKGKGTIDITQSRITRSRKLSDVDDTLYNYEFTWEVPAFTQSIQTCDTGADDCIGGPEITDKTNKVNVIETKKPDDKSKGSGIIGSWTFVTDNDPISPKYEQSWSKRDWGDQSFSTVVDLNPVEYRVTAVRRNDINDIISLIT